MTVSIFKLWSCRWHWTWTSAPQLRRRICNAIWSLF